LSEEKEKKMKSKRKDWRNFRRKGNEKFNVTKRERLRTRLKKKNVNAKGKRGTGSTK